MPGLKFQWDNLPHSMGKTEQQILEAKRKLLRLAALMALREAQTIFTQGRDSLPGEPPTVRTGNLRSSLGIAWVDKDTCILGVSARGKYGLWLERGTGIYGPQGKPIKPVNKKALHWKKNGQDFFARSVKGVQPRPFMDPAVARIIKRFKGAISVSAV